MLFRSRTAIFWVLVLPGAVLLFRLVQAFVMPLALNNSAIVVGLTTIALIGVTFALSPRRYSGLGHLSTESAYGILEELVASSHNPMFITYVLDQIALGQGGRKRGHHGHMLATLLPYLREGGASSWSALQMNVVLEAAKQPISHPELAIAIAEASGRIRNRALSEQVLSWQRLPRSSVVANVKMKNLTGYLEDVRKIEEAARKAPPLELLLRPSANPSVPPETLLRPATAQFSESHEEQLVRPTIPE